MCGGTYDPTDLGGVFVGLSPRVRGNHLARPPAAPDPGSIPACAGEPRIRGIQIQVSRVYPRVCGGTDAEGRELVDTRGLSPRVRGNRGRGGPCLPRSGSIPACAGEPRSRSTSRTSRRVYPRVCGGTASSMSPNRSSWGLSPRVRGNRVRGYRAGACIGSIPACAGEPSARASYAWIPRVYPRVCGGTEDPYSLLQYTAGLSPRVRGNRGPLLSPPVHRGSIPACAGEPSAPCSPPATAGVYPRVCGGTRIIGKHGSRVTGLSPRVRGNPRRHGRFMALLRSIPACAGEP